MKLIDIAIKGSRGIYRKLVHPQFLAPECELDRQKANDLIYSLLLRDGGCTISRFGTLEIGIVNNYLTVHSKENILKRCYQYITDNTGLPVGFLVFPINAFKCGNIPGINRCVESFFRTIFGGYS